MASLPDLSAIKTAMHNYYHPLIRQGRCVQPLY